MCSPLNMPRAGGASTACSDQAILVMGGTNDEMGYIMNIEEYDTERDIWE